MSNTMHRPLTPSIREIRHQRHQVAALTQVRTTLPLYSVTHRMTCGIFHERPPLGASSGRICHGGAHSFLSSYPMESYKDKRVVVCEVRRFDVGVRLTRRSLLAAILTSVLRDRHRSVCEARKVCLNPRMTFSDHACKPGPCSGLVRERSRDR